MQLIVSPTSVAKWTGNNLLLA